VTEVLSGDSHQALSASTPHQMWSSAMVIAPLLLGMFDLRVNALEHRIALSPQLPANWDHAGLRNIPIGDARVDLRIEQKPGLMRLSIAGDTAKGAMFDYAPAFSPHARILRATLNGRAVPFTIKASQHDQRVELHIPLGGQEQTVEVRTEGDVQVAYESTLPELGGASRGLRLTHESWSGDGATWTMQLEGASGGAYDLAVFGGREIVSVDGAELVRGENGNDRMHVRLSAGAQPSATVTLHLTAKKR
jgi:hypothetical protein